MGSHVQRKRSEKEMDWIKEHEREKKMKKKQKWERKEKEKEKGPIWWIGPS